MAGISILAIVAVWYQIEQGGFLQTQVVNRGAYYGSSGYQGSGSTSTTATNTSPSMPSPQDFDENVPLRSQSNAGLEVLEYLVTFDEVTILDGLQVSQHVPSFSSPVLWEADSNNSETVVIDNENASRTAFLTPSKETTLAFLLKVPDQDGNYQAVARYEFLVVSDLAYQADVNKDGQYDFQNDLVNLLRNWDDFGNEATRTLALILSRLEE